MEQHTKKESFWVFANRLLYCLVVCLFEFLTPLTLGSFNFLISNPFLTIVSVLDVSQEGVQVLFGHQKTMSPPLESGLP
jgi:hypothetical protein